MSKKKRSGAATSGGSVASQHTAATTHAATDTHGAPAALNASASSMASSASTGGHGRSGSLDLVNGLLPYYNQLAADIKSTPATLDHTLWIHNVIAVVILNVLMYDEHVGTMQLLMLLWATLWLGRAYIAASRAPPFVILDADRKRVVLWRVVLGVVGIAVHGPFLHFHDTPSRDRHVQLLLQIALVEFMSVALLDKARTRVTWPQIWLTTLEVLLVTSIFSVLYNHKEDLIYDHIAFALTGLSILTHTFLLLTAKFVALSQSQSQSQSRELNANWSQQRGQRLVAELRHAIDLNENNEDENDAVFVVKQKKKKAMKSQQQPHDTTDDASHQVTPPPKPLSVSKTLLQNASVQIFLLMIGQTCLLLLQIAVSTFLLLSWEITSVLMLSSAHVLWTLQQLHEKLMTRALETASA